VGVEDTAAMLEMLPPEAAEFRCVVVVDRDFWGVGYLVTMVQPAVPEFAVFSHSKGEGHVKAVYGKEERWVVLQAVASRPRRHEHTWWLGV
jgi:hypothetical protein